MRYDLGMYDAAETQRLLIMNDHLPDEFGPGLTYDGLLDRYRHISWGVHQASQPPRFSTNFGYDESKQYAQMLVDLLDPVHPVEHNSSVERDFQAVLLADQWTVVLAERSSPFEITAGRLALTFHDTGETTHPDMAVLCGGVVGDIPRGEKTPFHRTLEKRILEKIFSTLLTDVSDDLKSTAVGLITHAPEYENSRLHKLVEVAHDWGEYQTGLRAGVLATKQVLDSEPQTVRIQQLGRLAGTVLPLMQSTLDKKSTDFPFITQWLEQYAPQHERILMTLT